MTFVEPPQPPSGQYPHGQNPPAQYPQAQYPQGQYPPAHPQQKAPISTGRVVDATVSIFILVCGAVVLVVLVGIALFFGLMSSSSCATFGGGGCDTGAGWTVAAIGPTAIFAAAIAVTTVRLRRRRTAWWIALVGGIAAVAIWFLGSALASAGSA